MRRRVGPPVAALLVCLALVTACGGRLLRQYEYEEQVYLDLDGSATIVVNASIASLVALHGLPLDPDPKRGLSRDDVRRLYESPVTDVTRVSRPWRRSGRRFIQVRVDVPDIRRLPEAPPFAWSRYTFQQKGGLFLFHQYVGRPAGTKVPDVGWTGDELVAFRLHLPSRIQYHNAPSREVERGNIVSWEQPLRDRLAGRPVEIEARMETESILYRTLSLFLTMLGLAVLLMAVIVWRVRKAGRREIARATGTGGG